MLNSTNSPLEVRAAEAIRFALERTLATVRRDVTTNEAGDTQSIEVDSTGLTVGMLIVSEDFASGTTLTAIDDPGATAILHFSTGKLTTGTSVDVQFIGDLSALIRRADDPRSREGVPFLVCVQVVGLRQEWPGSDEFAGNLIVAMDSICSQRSAEDTAALDDAHMAEMLAEHQSRAASIVACLADVPALGDAVNPGATRPVADFSLYSLIATTEPGGIATGDVYSFEIQHEIKCARIDYN